MSVLTKQRKRYVLNRNRWRKTIGYSSHKPVTQLFADSKTKQAYTLDLNKINKHYDYFKLESYPRGMVIDYSINDLPEVEYYIDELVSFDTTSTYGTHPWVVWYFPSTFLPNGSPVIIVSDVTFAPESPEANVYIQQTEYSPLNDFNFVLVGFSGPCKGSFRIKAVYADSYPAKVTQAPPLTDFAIDASINNAFHIDSYQANLYGINTAEQTIEIFQSLQPTAVETGYGDYTTNTYSAITANDDQATIQFSAPTGINDSHLMVIYK